MKRRKIAQLGKLSRRGNLLAAGQSFIELLLVTMVLAIVLAGVVEFGFLLNNYLHVFDGSREAARFSSNSLAFIFNADGSIHYSYNPPFYYIAAAKAATTMDPVILNPAYPDDIVISVFTVSGSNITRFPNANGWSFCAHYLSNSADAAVGYAGFAAYFINQGYAVPTQLSAPGWSAGCTVRTSYFSTADIFSRVDTTAPSDGVLLFEIYYNYPQLLKLLSNNGLFGVTFSFLPDPVPLHVYTVMPISSAGPTPTP